ncbi:MAG: class I SAM-dependent methyltransferase [Candidatus Obscuribacterales bacterium]|nr:class I SAM-dependent methyltransferase [Candidatus Obscuribacterales bacterium]MBX9940947.1 class I SAM-dependent methyltransferase [Candidatus Obscuribacterales bacterium]
MAESKIKRNEASANRIPASYRDPSGYVYKENGRILRRLEHSYKEHYQRLIDSGLYEKLTAKGLLIKHTELEMSTQELNGAFKVIQPELVPFLSHPLEWSFSQLQDAAISTLEIAMTSLEHNMILKDASAYNIQFHNGKATLIDTLSFENYVEGHPWIAYRQFCEHFLAALAIQSLTDFRLNSLLQHYIDGIPLDLAVRLLPMSAKLKPALLMHLYMHADAQKRFEGKSTKKSAANMSKLSLTALLDSLLSCVSSLKLNDKNSEWIDYYNDTNYTDESLKAKQQIVSNLLRQLAPNTVWDCGANTGTFSRVAADIAPLVISTDMDNLCVNRNYLNCKRDKIKNIIPLVLDLTVPSPAIGWNNQERQSFLERTHVDVVLALALIHHLAISKNIRLAMIAECFAKLGKHLIIEFVPKDDSQVQRLLASREDIFDSYNKESFIQEFSLYYELKEELPIPNTNRTIFLFRVREN